MLVIDSLQIRARESDENNAPLVQISRLDVNPGEIATVIGASGSGKSTLLRWILGEPLKDFSVQGQLWLSGERIEKKPIERRGIGLMYQKGDLFPHLNVLENLVFAIPRGNRARESRNAAKEAAIEALESVNLADKLSTFPSELSGGEQSRIALIRSLLAKPQAILLDEPFSALDTKLRNQIREWTFNEIMERQIPAIVVTHDPGDHGNGPLIELGASNA